MGTKEAPNSQYVDLSMKVELAHGRDEDHGALSKADRVQYHFWQVVHSVGDLLHEMAEGHEVEHWPEDALPVATSALMMASVAVELCRRKEYAECLVTCEIAQRGEAALAKLLEY